MSLNQECAVLLGSASKNLFEPLTDSLSKVLIKPNLATLQIFKDNERNVQLTETIRGRRVFLVQSTYTPADNIWELLLMIDASKRAGAKEIIVVMPYAGYSRQERRDETRAAIGAAVLAKCIVSVGASHVITFDLHTTAIEGMYDGLPFNNIDGLRVFKKCIEALPKENLMFCSPDIGGIKRVKKFAKKFNLPWMACDKDRPMANEIGEMELMGNPFGKDIILVDDVGDTLGTILKATELLLSNGATSVRAILTHILLSGTETNPLEAYEALENSGITEVIVSDTVPLKYESSKVRVISIAPVLSDVIYRILANESLSN